MSEINIRFIDGPNFVSALGNSDNSTNAISPTTIAFKNPYVLSNITAYCDYYGPIHN